MGWMDGMDKWMGCNRMEQDGRTGWEGRMGWMNGWDRMDGMGWIGQDGMGQDGWMDEWGEGEQYIRDQMIPCQLNVISAHWLLTHIQSPPLRLAQRTREIQWNLSNVPTHSNDIFPEGHHPRNSPYVAVSLPMKIQKAPRHLKEPLSSQISCLNQPQEYQEVPVLCSPKSLSTELLLLS